MTSEELSPGHRAPEKMPSLPESVEPTGASPEFTEDTVPEALLRDHRTAVGRWAVLEVLEGQLKFVDLTAADPAGRLVSVGEQIVIPPEHPHRVELDGHARFQLTFYRESP